MAANHKLTHLLAGRTVKAIGQTDNEVTLRFTDDSMLTIKTAGPAMPAPEPHRTIQKVRQQATSLNLDFTDHSTLPITLAEATASVLLRDRQGVLEYAD